MNFTVSTEERYAHIDGADRTKVAAECAKKQKWIDENMAKQAARPYINLLSSLQLKLSRKRIVSSMFVSQS